MNTLVNRPLTDNFSAFFKRLNPSTTFEQIASSQYNTIKGLIEDPNGPAAVLSPKAFLQGSYKQSTAIYTINDVDIVVQCDLWYPGSGAPGSTTWNRDQIFNAIATPLLNDGRYRDKVRYDSGSMCIKVDLGIKVEILPVVFPQGSSDPLKEPFKLYRPETQRWEDGYARYHQQWLSWKNSDSKTGGNFIPAIKVFKHIRSLLNIEAVSFHIECLLFALPDELFRGSPCEYLEKLFSHLATYTASAWYATEIKTPCKERNLFTPSEWTVESWNAFHKAISIGSQAAKLANQSGTESDAIRAWQVILGRNYFA